MRGLTKSTTNWQLFQAVANDPRPQYEIAEETGRSDAWLSRVIHGRATASDEEQATISKILGSSKNELFPAADSVAA